MYVLIGNTETQFFYASSTESHFLSKQNPIIKHSFSHLLWHSNSQNAILKLKYQMLDFVVRVLDCLH